MKYWAMHIVTYKRHLVSFICNLTSLITRTEEPAKAGTCARDRRALPQPALNVHVKHSDLM